MSYYKPKTKKELIVWLNRRYAYAAYGFNKMDRKQLYAIYYRTINQHEGVINVCT